MSRNTSPRETGRSGAEHPVSRVVALLPVRGGSKSIPLKNIKPIAGTPLCVWSLTAALESGVFDEVYVSTDDARIAAVVQERTPEVTIIDRPAELATDTSSTESVMLHLAHNVDFDVLCTIQATSPLTSSGDFRRALEQFRACSADSLVTAVRTKRFFWNDDGTPINYDPARRPRRQDFNGTLMENGAFYFTTRQLLEQTESRLGGTVTVYEMPEETAAEIDEPSDWEEIERLLLRRIGKGSGSGTVTNPVDGDLAARIRALSWLFVDVDGTLTDGGMYYSSKGEELKRFCTRDAAGLRRLREHGINVGIITSEDSAIARARAAKLQVDSVFTGVVDKAGTLRAFAAEHNLELSQIGLIGDDLNDLPAMQVIGCAACPADAVPPVRAAAHLIAAAPGGHGAVREVCERIIQIIPPAG